MSNEQPPNAENLTADPGEEAVQPPMQNEGKADGWQMPKPVFKKTSGYLPQGFEKLVNAGREVVPEPPAADDLSAEEGFAPENVHVVEQPDISEHLLPDEEAPAAEPAVPKKRRSMAARIVLGLFFLLFMGVFVVAFLYVIITLFFSS